MRLPGHRGAGRMLLHRGLAGEFYRQQLARIAAVPYVRGIAAWLLYDFRTERRQTGFQKGLNRKGLIAEDKATRKLAFAEFQRWRARHATDPNEARRAGRGCNPSSEVTGRGRGGTERPQGGLDCATALLSDRAACVETAARRRLKGSVDRLSGGAARPCGPGPDEARRRARLGVGVARRREQRIGLRRSRRSCPDTSPPPGRRSAGRCEVVQMNR